MRIAGWILAAIIGALFGAAGTITHGALPTPVPIGLIIAFVGCAAILVALRCLTEDRITVVAGAIGMYLAVFLLSQRGPGGSVVVPATTLGYVWTLGIAVIILLVVTWPRFKRPTQNPPIAPGQAPDSGAPDGPLITASRID